MSLSKELFEATLKNEQMGESFKEILAGHSMNLEHLADDIGKIFAKKALNVRNSLKANLYGPSSDDLPFSFSSRERKTLENAEKEIGGLYKNIKAIQKKLESISKSIDSIIL